MSDDMLAHSDAAQYLGISVFALRNLRVSGKIPAVERGDTFYYQQTDLDRYKESNG